MEGLKAFTIQRALRRLGTIVPIALGTVLTIAVVLAGGPSARASSEISPDLIRRVELQWEPEERASSYEMELGTTPDFNQTLYSEKLTDTKFAVDLLPGAYYYRVRAVDQKGRTGRWTSIQELNINARPPVLQWPLNEQVVTGPLLDTGLPLEWRTSGPSIRYLIEIKKADPSGKFSQTIAKQEVSDTVFPFFPEAIGKYQWVVHTLGAGGDEPGAPWEFTIEGVVPPDVETPPGVEPKRIVRFIPPWWRGHWTLYARYGQSSLGYSIIDQDFRASASFRGFTGYSLLDLGWQWHDPVKWALMGVPWIEAQWELDRQTVLAESILLPNWRIKAGALYKTKLLKDWTLTPILEIGRREIAIYQPLSTVKAIRTNTTRNQAAIGVAAEYALRSFLTVGGSAQLNYQFGGDSGIFPFGGNFILSKRAGSLLPTTGSELTGTTTLSLGPRVRLQGRVIVESYTETWVGHFPTASGDPNTHVSYSSFSFDVSAGLKF